MHSESEIILKTSTLFILVFTIVDFVLIIIQQI